MRLAKSLTLVGVAATGVAVAAAPRVIDSLDGLPAACPSTQTSGVVAVITSLTGDSAAGFEILGVHPGLLDTGRRWSPSAGGWERTLAVHVGGAGADAPPVAGTYRINGSAIRFDPAFPPVPGMRYRVTFDASPLATPRRLGVLGGCPRAVPSISRLDTMIVVPGVAAGGPTVVTAVHPSAGSLPMNQLKLYVHFSAPMRAGEAAANVQLVDDATGAVVQDAFFRLDDEMWDPSQTRLTILFDPARIKRGLVPNVDLGLPLRAGRTYRLVVDGQWRDAHGRRLGRGHVKRFAVTEPDRAQPQPWRWTLSSPRAGSREALTLVLDEPMDHALLERLLVVRTADGRVVPGRSRAGDREVRWHFEPAEPWRAGRYLIEIDTALEDLAGNNLRRLFDADLRENLSQAEDTPSAGRVITLPWETRASEK